MSQISNYYLQLKLLKINLLEKNKVLPVRILSTLSINNLFTKVIYWA